MVTNGDKKIWQAPTAGPNPIHGILMGLPNQTRPFYASPNKQENSGEETRDVTLNSDIITVDVELPRYFASYCESHIIVQQIITAKNLTS